MKETTRAFLEQHLPQVAQSDDLEEVLNALLDLIDEEGFVLPRCDDFNDFGREAFLIYDDLMDHNLVRRKRWSIVPRGHFL